MSNFVYIETLTQPLFRVTVCIIIFIPLQLLENDAKFNVHKIKEVRASASRTHPLASKLAWAAMPPVYLSTPLAKILATPLHNDG